MIRALPILAIALAATAMADEPKRLTLDDAKTLAIKNHPRVRAAQASARAAGFVPTEIRAAYYPSVSANLTGAGAQSGTAVAAGNVTTSSLYSRAATGVIGTQLITDFGRTSKLVESAHLKAGAQQETVNLTRAQILLQVEQTYYRTLLAQSVLRVAQQTLAARKLTLKQVSALAQSSLKSTLDVSFADVNVSQAELELFKAENDIHSARTDLSAALGKEREEEYELVDEAMPGPLEANADTLISQALRERPELASQRLQRDAAKSFAASERKLWLPSIGIIAAAGALPTRDDRLHSSYSAAGLNVNFPILNGGLFSARRAEADEKVEVANQQIKDLEIQVARDVNVSWLNATNAYRRMDVTARLLDQASRAMHLAQARYDAGLGSIVELTQAQLNQTAAEITAASAKYEYQIERSKLDYASGALK
jgi:outer membrane protein